MASAGRKETRFHGRVEGAARRCSHPGCAASGEFRAPGSRRPSFDGPGEWRWLCLDHVRSFNAGYNYFDGMSTDEIVEAQGPYGGWERETMIGAHLRRPGDGAARSSFAVNGSPGPRWADFVDPLDAIGARFRPQRPQERQDGKPVSDADRKALNVLGLDIDADRRTLRQRYLDLVRRYHPDMNGGDRSHEKALQAVIEAYTALKGRPIFA